MHKLELLNLSVFFFSSHWSTFNINNSELYALNIHNW